MKKTFIGLALAAAMMFAGPAFAQTTTGGETSNSSDAAGLGNAYNVNISGIGGGGCCGKYYDYDNANGNATAVVTNFNQKLAAMQLAIIEAMRLSAGQASGNSREQTGAQHTLADAQDDRSTVKAVEAARIEAIQQATSGSTSCRIIELTRGGGTNQDANNFQMGLMKSLNAAKRGEEGPAKEGQNHWVLARLEAHCEKFGTSGDVLVGLCEKEGKAPAADVDGSQSIFYKKDGIVNTYDAERIPAVQAFTVHAFAPHSFTPFSKVDASTQAGRVEAASRLAWETRSAIADEAQSHYTSRRMPKNDDDLKKKVQGMAAKMTGYQTADYSHGVGYMDWFEIASKNYLLDPSFLANSDLNVAVATKDIKNMTAVLAYQGYEQYEMLERISMLLAAQLAILNESRRTDIVK